MSWKEIKLPCGHIIKERGKWCPACGRPKAKIEYGEPGNCPECNARYRTNKDGFYIENAK